MANESVNAAANVIGNGMDDTLEAFVGYCGVYSYAVLIAAIAFLGAGLVFVGIAASYEARRAIAEAKRIEEEARKAAADAAKAEAEAEQARAAAQAAGVGIGAPVQAAAIPVNAVVTFFKSFATVLGEAKAWVAMILIGLLLLWMAGNAPKLCASGVHVIGGENRQQESDSEEGDNSAANASEPTEGNGSGNAQTPANTAAAPPD
jgi:hypothetical protein